MIGLLGHYSDDRQASGPIMWCLFALWASATTKDWPSPLSGRPAQKLHKLSKNGDQKKNLKKAHRPICIVGPPGICPVCQMASPPLQVCVCLSSTSRPFHKLTPKVDCLFTLHYFCSLYFLYWILNVFLHLKTSVWTFHFFCRVSVPASFFRSLQHIA